MVRSLGAAAVLGLMLACGQPAGAQGPFGKPGVPYKTTPTFSPYLNLLRGGNTTLNYYGIVRPEVAFNNAIQQLGQQVAANQQADLANQAALAAVLPATGHPVSFMNSNKYFMTSQQRGGGVGPAMTQNLAAAAKTPSKSSSGTSTRK